jgi:spermidine synthase
MLWLVAVGLVTLWGQVLLLRELLVAFYGNDLVYIVALGALMLFAGLGALLGRRTDRHPGAKMPALFIAFAVELPLLLIILRALGVLLGGIPGAELPMGHQFMALGLVLAPFGILAGLLFQGAATRYLEAGGTLAGAYATESAGALAGGVLATVLVVMGVSCFAGTLLCALTAACAACAPRAGRPGRLAGVAVAVVLLLLAGLALAPGFDRSLTALSHPDLRAVVDTPYGRTVVAGGFGQVTVFHNGTLVGESQGTSSEEFVHLAALQCEAPRRVLILGGTSEGLATRAMEHGPQRVDLVEMDRGAVNIESDFLPEKDRAALADERVRRFFQDPRRFLAGAGSYDLILSAAPEPGSGESNRLFTREFFSLCRKHLSAEGVLALRLPSSENRWTKALASRNASVLVALRAVVPRTLVLPGTSDLVLASPRHLLRDPQILAGRWRARGISARLVNPEYIAYLMTNDRIAAAESVLARTQVPENTDARPACYPFTMLLWLSKFIPALGNVSLRGTLPWYGFALLPVLIAVAAYPAHRRNRLRRVLFVGSAGFAGMLLEGSLLLAYQARRGALYQDLGLLLTCFMGGLCLGAWGVGRAARKKGPGLAVALCTSLVGAGCAWAIQAGGASGRMGTGLLLAAAGACVGAAFAWAGDQDQASLWDPSDLSRGVAPLYAADLWGGCLGALLGSLIFLPFSGLAASAGLASLVGLAMLLLV